MKEEVEKYINEYYDILPDYPWDDMPNAMVFRHKSNRKWFALIMEVGYDKLKIDKPGMVYVINLKNIPEMIGSIRQEKGILSAYHMNKEHWITVLLDGTVSNKRIFDLIDISYELTSGKKYNEKG